MVHKIEYKFVDFNKYCKDCMYEKEPESMHKCAECLENPQNEETEKPVNFVKK